MKYTLNETSFQPSLSANIQIYQIFEKKGKSLPDFLCSPTSTGRKTTRKLDKISTPLRSSRKKRKRRGRLSSTAADEYPFSNAAEVHQFFFFFLFFSLGHLMVMCATIGRIYSSWRKPRSSFLFSTMKLKVSCWRHE